MIARRNSVVDLKTGQARPAVTSQPVLSSAGTPWEGVLLEQHRSIMIENIDVAPRDHVVLVQLKECAVIELKNGSDGFHTVRFAPGDAGVFPSMLPVSARTASSGSFLTVSIEPQFLLFAAHELVTPDRLELVPRFPVSDPVLRELALALKTEAEAGSPGGRVYAESIASTLALHLVRHYSSIKPSERESTGGLAKFRLRRVIDYVQAHLADDVTIEALSAAAGLSPYHFARLFKRSTGLAPRQYVIHCRVERAKSMLVHSNRSIANVAVEVGFCDQSHFAAHFRRIYGMTPKGFLQHISSCKRVA